MGGSQEDEESTPLFKAAGLDDPDIAKTLLSAQAGGNGLKGWPQNAQYV